MSFADFLKWVTGVDGGALAIIMWAVSWGLEEFGWWQALASKAKALIILGAAIVLGLLGVAAGNLPPEIVAAIEPYFRVVTVIIIMWLGSQVVHKVDKKLNGPTPQG